MADILLVAHTANTAVQAADTVATLAASAQLNAKIALNSAVIAYNTAVANYNTAVMNLNFGINLAVSSANSDNAKNLMAESDTTVKRISNVVDVLIPAFNATVSALATTNTDLQTAVATYNAAAVQTRAANVTSDTASVALAQAIAPATVWPAVPYQTEALIISGGTVPPGGGFITLNPTPQ